MKITMEKLRMVLGDYSISVTDCMIDMLKELGIEIIEETPDKLELARKFIPSEIYVAGISYTLPYNMGKIKHLYEEAIAELQEQIQKMRNCGNCGNWSTCSKCDGTSEWKLRED